VALKLVRVNVRLTAVVPFCGVKKKLHSKNDPVIVQVKCSWCPLHTEAIAGGDIITEPKI
jgi:hypothetical protein